MIGLAVDFEGRQIGCTEVSAEVSLSSLCIPDTGDNYACIGEDVCVAIVCGRLSQLLHSLHSDEALSRIEGIVNSDEFAGFVHGPVGVTTGCEEEGSGVPCVLKSIAELHVVLLTSGDDLFHALCVFCGDDGGIIIHVVTVVAGHGVCIQSACYGSSGNRACIVGSLDVLSSLLTGSSQSSSLYQASQLVLCEAVDIGSGCNVGNNLGACIGLGYAFDLCVDHDAGVSSFERIDLLLSQSGNAVLLGHPHGDVVCTCQFILNRCVGSSGVIGIIGGYSGLVTTCEACEHHQASQNQRQDLTHFHK